ncbi:MAG: GMC family oxidoreductase N-terminal domain-containing protein, partial [Verrucomicrobiae bacterium]|nr:GMC family oxidoreductase N-terminal domain-containing protein [Verrucomicrobiae bacterium]
MKCPVERRFHDVTSALVYSFAAAHADSNQPALQPPYNDVTAFVLRQHARLPDYLRLPLLVATLAFDLGGFHRRHPQARAKRVAAWKNSSFAFAQDLMRYHETLTTFALYSRADPAIALPPSGDFEPQGGELRCEVLVVGSGPAGSITACVLAEAGRDVLLLEEGDFYAPDSCAPFSQAEMEQKYRHGGQTVAFGRPKISYVEGCCVGGGSEINSGLYHRPSPELLEQWRRQFDVQHLTDTDLRVHCETIEKVISVSLLSNS